jgi:FkbM family methyltransferase
VLRLFHDCFASVQTMDFAVMQARLINGVGAVPIIGAALRRIARRFPEGSIVPIRTGVAAGLRWRRHHRYVNGYWIGNYEVEVQNALKRLLRPGEVFYDVGANAGFFSLLATKLVGPTGTVISFEPLPENVESIREQMALNLAPNWRLVATAMGGREGAASFSCRPGQNSMAHLGECGSDEVTITVEVSTLDRFIMSHPPPTLLKMDIEGAETEAFQGASTLLGKHNVRFLVEIHGPSQAEAVVGALERAGYTFETLDGRPSAAPRLEHHCVAVRNTSPGSRA